MHWSAVPLLAAAVFASGCVRVEHHGPAQHSSQTIERDNAELVQVDLNMGAGTLRVSDGDAKLMRADFDYDIPAWKPEVRYNSAAGRGTLHVRQPEVHEANLGNNKYEWDIRLNREVPLEVSLHFGAGEAHLDLSHLTLRRVAVDMGVGKLDLDLRGKPQKSYDVRVHGGVGEATVRLPSDVGVVAKAHGGIGEISASGLRHDGDRYVNEAYRTSPVTIRVEVEGGIGAIHLISD
jgi:hypothetical protein